MTPFQLHLTKSVQLWFVLPKMILYCTFIIQVWNCKSEIMNSIFFLHFASFFWLNDFCNLHNALKEWLGSTCFINCDTIMWLISIRWFRKFGRNVLFDLLATPHVVCCWLYKFKYYFVYLPQETYCRKTWFPFKDVRLSGSYLLHVFTSPVDIMCRHQWKKQVGLGEPGVNIEWSDACTGR